MRTLLIVVAISLLGASSASAQTSQAKGWLDVNFISFVSAQDDQTYGLRTPLFGETRLAVATYPALPTANGIEIGGGFRFGRSPVGFGIRVMNAKYTYDAVMAVSVPHPFFFNRPGADSEVSGELERHDRSIDLNAVLIVPTPDALSVKISGGPSYFNIKQDMVESIIYVQAASLAGANIVTITSHQTSTAEGSAWGFNVGGDVAYFFSKYVGVGGFVRFNKATVTTTEPLTQAPADLDAGGSYFGGGLRLRF